MTNQQNGFNVRRAGVLLPKTSWTLLVTAQGEGETAVAAREEFARRYYRPVHAYVRAIVQDPQKAEDLTQGFFTGAVATGRILIGADRAKGRFRPYLKQALRNFITDSQRRQQREERLFAEREHSVDSDRAVDDLDLAEDPSPGPDAAFHNAWVRALLNEAMDQVRATCEARGQQEHFKLFLGRYLTELDEPPSWRDLGTAFNLDEKTARSRADTVARHFRLVLRGILAEEVGVENIDEEIASLLVFL
jgi:RNA polymerase sigma factor (sigma-70 family)